MNKFLRYIKNKILFLAGYFNYIIPQKDALIVTNNNAMETNAIELANYIASRYDFPVFFVVAKHLRPYAYNVLDKKIKLVNYKSPLSFFKMIRCKYIFATHHVGLGHAHVNHVFINVWHGVGHKKVWKARGERGIPADLTVGTSELSKDIFHDSFGVSRDSIYIAGYPRNDLMIRAKHKKLELRTRVKPDITGYDKIVVWLPTYRRRPDGSGSVNMKLDNAFNIPDFDIHAFNEKLKKYNALCLLKPHYFYINNLPIRGYSHIKMIDEAWFLSQGLTLYHVLGCSDLLITDFSSVMIDYTLLDQPIVCFSKDLEGFKKSDDLYFDDFENWIPTGLKETDEDFLAHLNLLLSGKEDPYLEKRRKIRDLYFQYKDTKSSQRITEKVLGQPNKN